MFGIFKTLARFVGIANDGVTVVSDVTTSATIWSGLLVEASLQAAPRVLAQITDDQSEKDAAYEARTGRTVESVTSDIAIFEERMRNLTKRTT